jgi:hypothetical protein
VKRTVGVGLIAGAGYAAWRAWKARAPQPSGEIDWRSAPFPFPPVPRPRDLPAPQPASENSRTGSSGTQVGDGAMEWIDPNGTGACPATHPIKGKRSSGIYHVPGGANYDRTIPDRCYVNEEAAARDGMRRSKF